MRATLDKLIPERPSPGEMPDAPLLREYLKNGCPHGDAIILSFGETWTASPPALTSKLADVPRHAHGYQFSMYGLPALVDALRDRVRREHRLPEGSRERGEYEVAAAWAGTRGAMFDFGRIVLGRSNDARKPVCIVMGPSWDYEGVLTPLGFAMRYVHLRADEHFAPSLPRFEEAVAAVADEGSRLAMVVINAQHNPTGVNWDAAFVRGAVRRAIAAGAHVLVDDAYYGVHSPRVEPTSALAIVLDEARQAGGSARDAWLCVRSLGKQFHCNGWGLGVLAASPATLDELVNEKNLQHQLMFGAMMQDAMARWLESPESDAFLASQNAGYEEKRALLHQLQTERLGYPASALRLGECTSYTLMPLPPAYARTTKTAAAFVDDVFARCGVLLAPAWPWPLAPDEHTLVPYVRVYIGPSAATLREALERLERAGFHYAMPSMLGG